MTPPPPDERSEIEGRESRSSPASQARGSARIEDLITLLVQTAPACEPAVVAELVDHLHAIDLPIAQPLARSIAEVITLVAGARIDPGIALPPLAMACATLADGLRGALTARELEAARYEIDTLLPLPTPPPPPVLSAPDVPLSALSRGPRPRT